MILRIDDVSSNTDLTELKKILNYIVIVDQIKEVIVGINLFSKSNIFSSVYPNPPFKNKPMEYFYDVDSILPLSVISSFGFVNIASHGLLHVDHSQIHRHAQEISIITSCNLLCTKKFIPPFNKYDYNTLSICNQYGIDVLKPEDGWKSMDKSAFVDNDFDINYKYWYMHPWRWTFGKFKAFIDSKIN